MTQSYKTNQRRVILDFLFANKGRHMTAEEVLEALKANGHKISRATVYRHLEKLTEEAALRRYTLEPSRVALYEYCGCSGGYYHIKCDVCGDLRHLTCESVPAFFSHVEADHNFIIDPERTTFYGTCGECRNKGGKDRCREE